MRKAGRPRKVMEQRAIFPLAFEVGATGCAISRRFEPDGWRPCLRIQGVIPPLKISGQVPKIFSFINPLVLRKADSYRHNSSFPPFHLP